MSLNWKIVSKTNLISLFHFMTKIEKGCDLMTIEELKEALDRIPKTGAINKARRLQIQKRIFELMHEAGMTDE